MSPWRRAASRRVASAALAVQDAMCIQVARFCRTVSDQLMAERIDDWTDRVGKRANYRLAGLLWDCGSLEVLLTMLLHTTQRLFEETPSKRFDRAC